jgi:hypothetical protein
MATRPMLELSLLLLLLLVILYFNDAAKARDLARTRARDACATIGVQFLDQSVAIAGLGLRRGRHGRLRIARRYRFEFSRDRANREPGYVQMIGAEVSELALHGENGWQYL